MHSVHYLTCFTAVNGEEFGFLTCDALLLVNVIFSRSSQLSSLTGRAKDTRLTWKQNHDNNTPPYGAVFK